MNALIDNNYSIKDVKIMSPIKNFIINDGYFYKFIYQTNSIAINNLIFMLNISDLNLTKISNQKYKLSYKRTHENLEEIHKISKIERDILNKINMKVNLKPRFDINTVLTNSTIKIFGNNINTNLNNLQLKIKLSGIWSTNKEYGITYRFLI